MRIAILNQFSRIVGGAEQYLAASIPRLVAEGHEVRLWAAKDSAGKDDSRSPIECPTLLIPWRPEDGDQRFADWFDSWSPEVICVHSPLDAGLEQFILLRYPAIYFGHSYAVTCISGGKTLYEPSPHPCSRRLGPGCLAHYYPHHCGGLNPVTMLRNYSQNIAQRHRLLKYAAVITFSSHMRDEYERHGVEAGKVRLIRPFCPQLQRSDSGEELTQNASHPAPVQSGSALTIGFIGRLEKQKGVDFLLRALPGVADKLQQALHVVIAGEGRDDRQLHELAARITRGAATVHVRFQEWITSDQLDDFYSKLSLLVVPSVWPEPFGLVGLEACARAVPVAAFAVGGIPDWLIDGVNGHLAPAIPTVAGLTEAIVSCLINTVHYAELCQGAREVAAEFSARQHTSELISVLGDAMSLPLSGAHN